MIANKSSRVGSTTVGIVAYHRPQSLARLLTALDDNFDVVVANVEDDPEIADVVERAGPHTCAHAIANRGYGAAVNWLGQHSSGDVVVFMNDDVTITGSAIRILADAVRDTRYDAALPKVVAADGAEEHSVLALPTPGRILLEWALLPDEPIRGIAAQLRVEKWRMPQVTEQIEAGTAAVVAVKADLLRTMPMPEDYFLYWEELDWFWRLRASGHRVALVPNAVATHGGGRADVRPDKSRLMARNAVRCVRRTQGRHRAALALMAVIAWNLRLVALDAVRVLGAPSRQRRARVTARLAGLLAALTSWRELR